MNLIGGKTHMLPYLIPLVPNLPKRGEPFARGFTLTLNLPAVRFEFYNDLDPQLANLFRVVKYEWIRLTKILRGIKCSKEVFEKYKSYKWEEGLYGAVRTFILLRMSRGKDFSWSSRIRRNMPEAWLTAVLGIPLVAQRIRNVDIWNRNGLDVLEDRCGDSDTFMYLDPPYLKRVGTEYGSFEMDHERLLRIITQSKAKILLSGYDDPLYWSRLSGWKSTVIPPASQTEVKPLKNEYLWRNY